jgi:hypothetical protein
MGGTRVARRRVNWRKNSSESWLKKNAIDGALFAN